MSKSVIVKETLKKGKGVFAVRDFKKREIILNMNTRKTIPRKDVQKLSKDDQDHLGYIGKNRYFVMKPPERFINHSCSPNAYDKTGTLIALKNIKKGKEICTDYSINGYDDWKMICYCGSKNCRKIIYGNFFKLPKKLQKKYEPYLDDWFKKEFLKKK